VSFAERARNADAAPAAPDAPSLVGRRITLLPVVPDHYQFLYELATSEEIGFRWRYGGQIPQYETFVQQMWSGVLTQFLITQTESGRGLGLTVAYNADLRNGHAYIAAVIDPREAVPGGGVEANALFLDYLFATWNFRKLYAEVLEFNLVQFSSGLGNAFREEGVLRAHHYYAGRFWDQHLVAYYRETWETEGTRILERVRASADRRSERRDDS
jgi:RimJ/RimL family protein N-acetyltransferase